MRQPSQFAKNAKPGPLICESCESGRRYDADMAKTYVGARLRRLRESHGLNQSALAERLGISPSYLNQLERGKRPLTVAVLLRVTEEFGVDADFFAARDSAKLMADVKLAIQDGLGSQVSEGDIAELATRLPDVAAALVNLHRKHRDAVEQTAALLTAEGASLTPGLSPLPHEEVRDFFYARHNHVAELDEAAERQAEALELRPGNLLSRLTDRLLEQHGIRTVLVDDDGLQHRLDARQRLLYLASRLTPGQQSFRIATQLALLEHRESIDELADAGQFTGPDVVGLARIGLANYFAGALIMPYHRFRTRAETHRYDIERLAADFGVGFETACHRLSTLQRPRQRGVPFSFVRVDRAGNISKRQSATGFHFSRSGGTCPLWNVYEAFTNPNRVLVQMARMPDDRRYLWIARTVTYRRGGYRQPGKEFAIGLGCEIQHANRLVYSRGLDLNDADGATPIGMGCKVCDRSGCAQRAFPPVGRTLHIDERSTGFVPYQVLPPSRAT